MAKSEITAQDAFWSGEFGDEYSDRNLGKELLASNVAFFASALKAAAKPNTCIEFGANIGMNLRALKSLFPDQVQQGVEINAKAAGTLADFVGEENVHHASILEFEPQKTYDLALIKGVLIHIAPDYLDKVYDLLVKASARYVLVAEYYNPVPVSIPYRGHEEKLFKRDFAGELLDRHPQMRLLDYGFTYHRDPKFPQDDITWFLLEKGQ